MKLPSSDTEEEGKNWKLQYKSKKNLIPDKYITCWLGYKKNPYKDKFQMTNYFRNVLVSQRWVCWAQWKHHRQKWTTKTDRRNFFLDHFLKELRYQVQLGNQAFWWFVYNSILTSPDWLKCDWMGTGKGTFLLLAREKTNGIRIFCLWGKIRFLREF